MKNIRKPTWSTNARLHQIVAEQFPAAYEQYVREHANDNQNTDDQNDVYESDVLQQTEYIVRRKQELQEERERNVVAYEALKREIDAKHRRQALFSPSTGTFVEFDLGDLKKLEEAAKKASMTPEEAYLNTVLNSLKQDMPQTTLEAAISQKKQQRKWYQETFQSLSESDNPAKWIIGNLGKYTKRLLDSGIIQTLTPTTQSHLAIAADVVSSVGDFIAGQQDISYEADTQADEQKKLDEFYSYTPAARQKAFNQWAKQKNIKSSDTLDSIPIKEKKGISKEDLDSIDRYHQLISPDEEERQMRMRTENTMQSNAVYTNSQWRKDAIHKFLENMNQAQADNYQGRIVRTQELLSLVTEYENYLNNKQLASSAKELLYRIQNGMPYSEKELDRFEIDKNLPAGQIVTILRQIAVEADNNNSRYSESIDKLMSFVPDNVVDKLDTRLGASVGEVLNQQFNKFIGLDYSAPLFNDGDYIRYFLQGLDPDAGAEHNQKILNRFKKAAAAKIQEWEAGRQANEADIAKLRERYLISDHFNWMEQNVKGGLFNADVWAYQMPGFQGSSNSSWIKQLPSTAINVAAMLYSGGSSSLLRLGAATQSMALGHSAGADENYAELGENYRQKLKTTLSNEKLYDEFIKQGTADLKEMGVSVDKEDPMKDITAALLSGRWSPSGKDSYKMRMAAVRAASGSNSLFELDMRATTLDDFVNTTLMLTPFGGAAKEAKMLDKIIDLTGDISVPAQLAAKGIRKTGLLLEKNYKWAQNFAKHFDDLGNFVQSLPRTITSKIAPNWAKKGGKWVKNLYAGNLMSEGNQIVYRTIRDNVVEIGKRVAESGFAEGIEEGKQYLHGKEYQEGAFDADDRRRWFNLDTFVKDAADGFSSARVALGVPFGLALTSDAEWVENVKGGILGALFQTGGSLVLNSIKPTIQQAKMNQFIYKTSLMDKAADMDAFRKGVLYAMRAKDNPVVQQELMQAFDQYEAMNESRKQAGQSSIDSELIREQKKIAQDVIGLANSSLMKRAAKSLDIDQNSDDYYKIVSTAALFGAKLRESSDLVEDLKEKILEEEGKIETPYHIDEMLGVVNQLKLDSLFGFADAQVQQQKKEDGETETQEETLARVNEAWNKNMTYFAQIAALQRLLNTVIESEKSSNYYGQTRKSNDFLKRRLNQMIDDTLDMVYDTKQSPKENKENRERVLKSVESYTSLLKNKEELIDLYRQQAFASLDRDFNSAMFNMVVGNQLNISEDLKKSFKLHSAKDIIEAIEKATDKDYQLYDAIEKDYLDNFLQVTGEQLEKGRKERGVVIEEDELPFNLVLKADILNKNNLSSDDIQGHIKAALEKHAKKAPGNASGFFNRLKKNGITIPKELKKKVEKQFYLYASKKASLDDVLDSIFDRVQVTNDNQQPTQTEEPKQPITEPAVPEQPEQPAPAVAPVQPTPKQRTPQQQAAIDELNKKWENDQKAVRRGEKGQPKRSGHDYFLEVDENEVLFPRVHTVNDPLYIPTQQTLDEIQSKRVNLRNLWSVGKKEEFKKAARKYAEEWNAKYPSAEEKVDVDVYLSYLEKNPKDIGRVIEAVANLTTHRPAGVAVKVGNVIHDFAARFFGGSKKPLIYSEFSKYMPEEVYNQLIAQFTALKEKYDALGWYVDARPQTFYREFVDKRTGQIVRVAGEIDAVAIDENGKKHIIDFKTSFHSFLPTQISTPAGLKTIDPFRTIPDENKYGEKGARSTADQYSQQLTLYAQMMDDVESIEIVPLVVKYRFHDNDLEGIDNVTMLNDGQLALEFSNGIRQRFVSLEDFEKLQTVWLKNKTDLDKLEGLLKQLADSVDEQSKQDALALLQQVQTLNNLKFTSALLITQAISKIPELVQAYYTIKNTAKKKEIVERTLEQSDIDEINKMYREIEEVGITWNDIYEDQINPEIRRMDNIAATFNDTLKQAYDLAVRIFRENNLTKGADLTNTDPQVLTTFALLISILRKALNDAQRSETIVINGQAETILVPISDKIRQLDIITANKLLTWASQVLGVVGTEFVVSNDYGSTSWHLLTTTWKASIEKSHAVNDESKLLLDVSANADFIEKADFQYVRQPNKSSIYVLITYNGVTYTPVEIHGADTPEGKEWYKQVVRAIRTSNGKPVRPNKVRRTFGRYKNGTLDTLVGKGLVSPNDLYSLTYGGQNKNIGVVKKYAGQTVVTTPSVNGGMNILHAFSNSEESEKLEGQLVLMVTPQQNEVPANSRQKVPVMLLSAGMTEGDADLIINILTGKYNLQALWGKDALDQEFLENGVAKGLTNRQVLNLLLPVELFGQKGNPIVHIDFSDKYPYMIHVKGRITGDPIKTNAQGAPIVPDRQWDLRNPDSVVDINGTPMTFRLFLLKKVNKNISEYILRAQLGNDDTHNQLDSPIKNLAKWARTTGARLFENGGQLRFGNSSIVFESSDFENPNTRDRNGMSGLGWYVKNGFILTDFEKHSNVLLDFTNTGIQTDTSEQPIQQAPQQPISTSTEAPTEPMPPVVPPTPQAPITTQKKARRRGHSRNKVQEGSSNSSFEQAKANIERILGVYNEETDSGVMIAEMMAITMAGGAYVVGRCYSDCILLSTAARPGVEYHEAFHRISEILMTDEERSRIYKLYKRRNPFVKDPIEGIADLFMDFMTMNHTYDVSFSYLRKNGLWNWFKQLGTFVRVMYKLGGKGLYKAFCEIERGKYANKIADPKKVEQFAKNYNDGLNFTIRGKELKTIVNEHMYRAACNSVASMMLDANAIDVTLSNVAEIKVSKQLLEESRDYKEYTSDDSLGSDVLHEFVDNWDAVVPDIVSLMSSKLLSVLKVQQKEPKQNNQSTTDPNAPVSVDMLKELADAWGAMLSNQQEDTADDADGAKGNEDEGDARSSSISEHIHESYEFSQFSRTTPKVKFFFSRIYDCEYDENGDIVDKLNEMDLPYYLDGMRVFNLVLNECWDIDNDVDLISKLDRLAEENAVFKKISDRIKQLKAKAQDGEKVDEDAQQLLTQIVNAIKTNKQNFGLVQIRQSRDGKNSADWVSTDQEYNAREFKSDWSLLFIHGAGDLITTDINGNIVMKEGKSVYWLEYYAQLLTSYTTAPYMGIPSRLGLAYAFSELGMEAYQKYLNGDTNAKVFTLRDPQTGKQKAIDVTNVSDLNYCKDVFCQILAQFGILFDKNCLNFMLRSKYGSSGYLAMRAMFEDTGTSSKSDKNKGSISTFVRLIRSMVDVSGKLPVLYAEGSNIAGRDGDTIYTRGENTGFVGELATYKYLYQHSQDQLSQLVVGGNKFYQISERNLLTDRTLQINRAAAGLLIGDIEGLMSYDYNLLFANEQSDPIGSIIFKQIHNARKNPESSLMHIEYVPFPGMKSDLVGDEGLDYFQIAQRDDELGKIFILQNGGIMSPTMSDKKSMGFIHGIVLPGVQWNRSLDQQTVPTMKTVDGLRIVVATDDVLEQMLEYALCERAAISTCLEDVFGYVTEDGIEIPKLPKEQLIDNYHKTSKPVKDSDGKEHIVIQGARFSSLLGVYDGTEYKSFNRTFKTVKGKDGKEKSVYISEQENLSEADKYFFAPRKVSDTEYETSEQMKQRQKMQIARLLHERLIKELLHLESLGIIKIADKSSDKAILGSITNVFLNDGLIDATYHRILQQYGLLEADSYLVKDGQLIKIPGITSQLANQYRSLAIASYMMDNMSKAIMSKQEFERVFAGHPAFFKWGYSKDGKLTDRSVDQHKRYGGLVSTGVTGNNNLPNSRSTYTCAQVANEMIESPMLADIERLMKRGQLILTYVDYLNSISFGRQVSVQDEESEKNLETLVYNQKVAEGMTNEQIEEELRKNSPEALAIAETIYTQKINAFRKDKKNKGIDVADGAAYISDEMCELLLRRAGSFDSKVAEAFKILRDPSQTKNIRKLAEAYKTVTTTVIGTQKYTAYGFRHNGRQSVPFYNKMALFPLFRSICSGRMAAIFEQMHKQGIDVLMTDSAVKLGGQGSTEINWDNGVPSFNTYEQSLDDLRKQFNTDPDETKKYQTMGTQMTKIIMSALRPGVLYKTQDGRSLSPIQLRNDIMSCMRSLSAYGKVELEEMFFENGKPSVEKFSKIITDELSRRGASRDTLDSFSVVNGEFKLNPAAQSNLNWIQSIIASVVNKRVIDTNTFGNLFVQRSVWGMEGPTVVDDSLLDSYPTPINGGERLKMINEEGSMDCVISIDYYAKLIPNYESISFDEAKQWLINNDIIDGVKTGTTEWHHVKASIVGYRIPTQAISSIHALRVVDVLPVVRDTIILPAEFTKITGSDFDIDKLFLSGITYTVVDGKAKSEFATTNVNYWRNTLIRDQISLLINKDENENPYNIQQLHGSIDNDTDLLLKVVDELSGNETVLERMPYDDYVLSTETSIKNDLVTGKVGIGPFALNNNNHVLTTLYGVELTLKRDHILNRNGFISLHDYTDRDGNSILSWLSGLINAHVDIAKDSYISKLNVNPFTYNLVNLLIRLGLGKTTFYFTRQPILKELAIIVSNAKGISGNDKSMSQSAIVRQAEENYIKNLIAEYIGTDASSFKTLDDALDVLKDDFKKKGISVTKIQDQLLQKGDDVLRNVAKNSPSVKDTGEAMVLENKKGHYTINNMQLQLIVYLMYKEFEPVANNLAKLVKYSKIDTKKQGTTLAEQLEYETGYNDVLYGKTSRMFKNVDKMMLQSYIDTKTQESISTYRTILKSMLFEATKGFQDAVSIVLNEIGEADTQNILLIKQVYNSVMFSIKSKFINSYANRNGINIKELVSGDNTMFDRLGKLRIALRTDPKYADLIDQNGEITNPLIAALVTAYSFGFDEQLEKELSIYHTPEDTYPNAKFIKLLNFLDDEQLDSNSLTTAWQELLEDNNRPELQQFARDLIVYAFITSGDVGGVKNLFRFVPMSWKKDTSTGQSYENFMAKALKLFQNNPNKIWDYVDTDDIILNNWKEYAFMPTMKYSTDKRKLLTPIYTVNVVQNDTPYYDAAAIVTDLVENDGKYSTTFGSKPPRYFKIKRGNDLSNESQRSYAIYKHVGVGLRPIQVQIGNDFVSRLIRYNIYQLVDPKGNQYRKGFRILEYGRSDASDNEFSQKIEKNPVFGVNEFAPNSFSEFVEQIEALKQHPQFGKLNPVYSQDDAYSSVLDIVNDIERNERVLNIEIIESTGFYTREDVEKDQGSLYIFTDNTDRDSGSDVVDPESDYAKTFGNGRELHYPRVTSAAIRGLDNACPISTLRYYHEGAKYEAGNWSDEDIDEFKSTIDFEIEYIKSKWQSGNYTRLVLPEGGFFNEDSISNLSKHPQLAEYLELKLDELYSFVYGDGTTSDINIDQHPNTTPAPTVPQLGTLTITPIQQADKKAIAKGKISNKFIGFADGIQGSSTAEYARQAGNKANTGDYNADDTIFVSIPGKRGDAAVRSVQQRRTIEEALKALDAGATLVTDNTDYVANSDYNEGEKLLAESLHTAGATYSERTVDGHVLGVWKKEGTYQSSEAGQFDQFVRDNSNWNNPNEFSDEEMKHCKH